VIVYYVTRPSWNRVTKQIIVFSVDTFDGN
jgi:hypothetical protein